MRQPEVLKKAFRLPTRSGDFLHGDVRWTEGPACGSPVVIICHSFMAFKEWGFFPHVAERFARAGLVSVIFNFSFNGVVGDGTRITDFARFERNTFSRELDDLDALADFLASGGMLPAAADVRRIAILGHSRGGGLAVVHGADDRRVNCVVTWSAIATFDRWTAHQKANWRTTGHLPLAKDSAVSPLRLGVGLLDDVEENGPRLDIVRAGSRLGKPWLLLHGREDLTVPVREAEALYAASDKRLTELRLLDHVGHLYHAATRAEDHYRTLDGIVDVSAHWLSRTLT
jgi:dienelactone hydrolase